jgi:hypothetical protein
MLDWAKVTIRARTRNTIVGLAVGYGVAVAMFMLGGPRWLAPLLIVGSGFVAYRLPED